MDGFTSHRLHRCLEVPGRYLLLIQWTDIERHTVGFDNRRTITNGRGRCITFVLPFPSRIFRSISLLARLSHAMHRVGTHRRLGAIRIPPNLLKSANPPSVMTEFPI